MSFRRLNAADAPGKVRRAALAMFPSQHSPLRYLDHALKASLDDRYGNLVPFLPKLLDTHSTGLSFVEVEISQSGTTEKVVLRLKTSLMKDRTPVDLVLVVARGGLVRTVWGNVASDHHKTLRRERLH